MSEDVVEVPILLHPEGGTPDLIDTANRFDDALTQLSQGHGPFAVDAERASGYRYSARAYLIQIKRAGGGLHLIDPTAFSSGDFARLNTIVQSDEVILHASTQDLPCLRELGINPLRLFDTELGARIAGFPRVGLGPLVENLLGIGLAKEHSAVDWSIRPLPQEWLTYAALDVELLIELRDQIAQSLESQKKLDWALQDFQSILSAPPPPPRIDPWRRTSGMHKVKRREQLAIVRELWNNRAALAAELDIAQGRLLSDSAIVELAMTAPRTRKAFDKTLRPLGLRPRWSERASIWIEAIERALALTPSELPELRSKSDGIPPVKIWKTKFPEKYAPFSHGRCALAALSTELAIPVENILSPDILRRLVWAVPDPTEVEAMLLSLGARPWQAKLVTPALTAALAEREPLDIAAEDES